MAAKQGTKRGSAVEKPILPNKLIAGVQTAMPASGKDPDAALFNQNASYFNKSIKDLRTPGSVTAKTRLLARVHGDTATAVAAMVRLANTELQLVAYDAKHQLSDVGTALVRSLMMRFDCLNDYTYGFDDRMTVAGVKEALLREIPVSGGCGVELVLDANYLPYRLLPVSCNSDKLKWKTGKGAIGKDVRKVVPYQTVAGSEVILDVPTFFYAALDQDPEQAYASPLLEPAVNTAPFHAEVLEDVRKVVRRSGHSRLMVKLLTEQLSKAAPPDVKADPAKYQDWLDQTRTQVEQQLENLSPESALVFFDTIEASYLNSEIGASADYSPLIESLDGILSTALRTPPSVLGKRMGGSQNVTSTESLLFIKTAEGLHAPVESVMSRALTLAVRMFGFDGYVKARFSPINLRPSEELEAFRQMQQARVLEALSLGFLQDQEAAEMLGYGPRAPGAPPLSGTMFYGQKQQTEPPSPNADPARRALTTDAPKSGGGADNKQR